MNTEIAMIKNYREAEEQFSLAEDKLCEAKKRIKDRVVQIYDLLGDIYHGEFREDNRTPFEVGETTIQTGFYFAFDYNHYNSDIKYYFDTLDFPVEWLEMSESDVLKAVGRGRPTESIEIFWIAMSILACGVMGLLTFVGAISEYLWDKYYE